MINKIKAYIDAHEQEMLQDAMALISINSERTEAKPGMPFGEGCAAVLKKAEEVLGNNGFAAKNYDNYVVAADLNDKPARLDILAHLDVVPAGEGFTVCEPFEPVVKDGNLYGRGSADDKGPAVAALYAMKAVRELNPELSGNCRLIWGSDEECGSSDIRYYYGIEKHAPMTFSPDAEFPLINIEKGSLGLHFEAKTDKLTEGVRLVSSQVGTKRNVVPGKAAAVIAGMEKEALAKIAQATAERTNTTIELTETAEGVNVLFVGEFCHAASPENGNNALTALLSFLADVPMTDAKQKMLLENLAKLYPHGDWNGKALGVDHEDEESGKLTLCLTIFSYDGETMQGDFDCRAPLCANETNTRDVVYAKMSEAGFTYNETRMNPPHYVPQDTEFVQTLLSCYTEVTGRAGKPIAIGGGTYVHHIENGVAFGCADLGVDNRMHGADEFMSVEQMKTSAVIFALAIMKLCK